jgi:hypothetical protein
MSDFAVRVMLVSQKEEVFPLFLSPGRAYRIAIVSSLNVRIHKRTHLRQVDLVWEGYY